jgi:hypothetical protein
MFLNFSSAVIERKGSKACKILKNSFCFATAAVLTNVKSVAVLFIRSGSLAYYGGVEMNCPNRILHLSHFQDVLPSFCGNNFPRILSL